MTEDRTSAPVAGNQLPANKPDLATPPATGAPRRDLGPDEYAPTAKEVAAIQGLVEIKEARPAFTHVKVVEDRNGNVDVSYKHVSQSLAEIIMENAIGVSDGEFLHALYQQLVNATMVDGKVSERMMNFALAVIRGAKPKDELEVLHVTQMAAVHLAQMSYAHRLVCARNNGEMAAFEVGVTKLARTFSAQMEALKKYRAKGEQKVIVEHVHVHGGQAIVGNVHQGAGGARTRNEEQIHGRSDKPPALAAPDGAALPITLEAKGQAVRKRSRAGEDQVQVSRRAVRRSEGKQEQPQTRTFHGASDCGASQDSLSAARSEGHVRSALKSGAHEDGKISR